KLQVCRDPAGHPFMTGDRVAALTKTPEHVSEKGRPTDEERAHEPVTELDDVIDLVTVLGSVRRHPDQLVDESQTSHISRSPRRSIARAARAARSRGARDERRKR